MYVWNPSSKKCRRNRRCFVWEEPDTVPSGSSNKFLKNCCSVREKPALGLWTFSVERYSIVYHPSHPKGLGCWGFPGVGAGFAHGAFPWMIPQYFAWLYTCHDVHIAYREILYMKHIDQTNDILPKICSKIRDMAGCYHPLSFSSSSPVKRRIIFELRCFWDHLFV